MKKSIINTNIIWALLIIMGISSCGTNQLFTKHRYTGGFHLNLSLKKDKGEVTNIQKASKRKVVQNTRNTGLISKTVQTLAQNSSSSKFTTLSFNKVENPTFAYNKKIHPAFFDNKLAKKALSENSILTSTNVVKAINPKSSNNAPQAEEDGIILALLVILALILPPLAVFIVDGGATGRFWINLIFWAIGYGGFALFGAMGGLLGLIAIIHALLIVFGVI